MMQKRSFQALLGAAALAGLAACSMNAAPEPRSPKALAELNKALAGKVAGKPVSCLPSGGNNDMQVIDDNAILYHAGKTAYLQEMRGGCSGLDRIGATLVTTSYGGGRLCDGDIARVVDLSSGMTYGSCAMGPFVPYAPPR